MELSDFYEHYLLGVPVMELKAQWFAFAEGFNLLHRDMELRLKRLVDFIFAIMGLTLVAPVLVVVSPLVVFTSSGPALYSQIRCGQHGRQFRLHKFRSTFQDAERKGAQWSQPADPRVTPVGRFLRRTRLDELPQLWNVLVGDMSFIGPCPERPDFVREQDKEIPYYELRHLLKPGITG